MGIGKYLAGGLCVVGAIVAAPIVLPAAAAAAAAAGTAIAGSAVGTAVAAAGTAVAGSAVGTAVTAAGTAVASSAVGTAVAAAGTTVAGSAAATAVGGAMATVGTAVASATSVVGISSVASTIAVTGAGATAVGTMSTAGAITALSTMTGVKKLSEAKEIVEDANSRYNEKKERLDQAEKYGNEALKKLGKLKISVWDGFDEFYTVVSKIKNCKMLEGNYSEENIHLSKDELDNIQTLSITAGDLLKTSAGSIGVGALTGLAAYGGTMASGVASTGTLISSLSGVAATNATLASLGGGSLAAGGLGMAGGTTVLGGLVAAPALAVGGLLLAAKGISNLEKAHETSHKADEAIKKFQTSIVLMNNIKSLTHQVYGEINQLLAQHRILLSDLSSIVETKTDFRSFTPEEAKTTELCILSIKILKSLTTTDLLVKKNNEQAINREPIEDAIHSSKNFYSKLA
ncbi:hypothetical protein [Trichococcus pasteurii]|uniref:Uncharacterized protein n=1 Tax=Trichococcus pasteurii TaxID=43064 RepID=A0A1W1IDS5_9LACT|nr:hypothetical protein [Trichococcus pasteurii]SFF04256.1 hypothetical protein SAMN04488086_1222 [Trichococcus pasteurii]SLM51029.1 Hypothetical protein TPAS_704 [Trichococcus pasteurii]SSB91910.1 Hypothetical protein TPAS_704 [Trichococcus pasteurii]